MEGPPTTADAAALGAELVLRANSRRPPHGCNYIVSISKKAKFRRLHFSTACWRVPGVDYQSWEDLGDTHPPPEAYDAKCKDCWSGTQVPLVSAGSSTDPAKKLGTSALGAAAASSSSSGASESSSTEERDTDDEVPSGLLIAGGQANGLRG